MVRKKNEHQSISEALQDFVKDHRLQQGLDKVHVREAWTNQMGPAIAKYTTAIKLDRDVLYIQLSSSVLRDSFIHSLRCLPETHKRLLANKHSVSF